MSGLKSKSLRHNVLLNYFSKAVCCCLLASFVSIQAWGYEKLQPFAGTVELGGTLQFPMEISHEGDFTMWFRMNPSLGFFVEDGWELIIQGVLNQPIVDDRDVFGRSGGFGFGFRYLFDGGYVLPYLGSLLDFVWAHEGAMAVVVETPMGMLIPFNDYVAADLGIAIRFIFPTDFGFEKVIISPGFLGVKAFF